IPLNVNDVPIYQSYIDQVTASPGIEVKAKSKWLNCLHIRGSVADITALTSFNFVDHIQFADNSLNAKNASIKPLAPVNKNLNVQTTFAYGNSANQIQMLNGHLLHQQNFTGTGKIIAVLDAGFPGVDVASPFQRLRDNNQILGGYNFVDRNTNVYTNNSHGTLVLSSMGGYVENQLVGTAPDAQYYLFITEDTASENPVEESNWVEAAEEADRLGVDIITTSLGYFSYDNPAYSHTYSDMTGNTNFASKGANIAFSKGIVVVASAGNEGGTPEPHVGVPAEANDVLAIGAVRPDRTRANFSSIGPSFDNRIKPDVMAQGQSCVLSNTNGDIISASGTSFSGPIMAGMIACLWQAVPGLSNQAILNLVKQSSDNYATPNEFYGYGIPDFELALMNTLLSVEQSQQSSFTVYPNPIQTNFAIHFSDKTSEASILIYNNLGQLILQNNQIKSDIPLDISSLSSGIYFYKIEGKNETQTGKLIKN
ncbi:MAG: S8 family serine peptidase, partial [Arcicella sp.]|nr:S8 family serine peptidase [Arcicella sp.]